MQYLFLPGNCNALEGKQPGRRSLANHWALREVAGPGSTRHAGEMCSRRLPKLPPTELHVRLKHLCPTHLPFRCIKATGFRLSIAQNAPRPTGHMFRRPTDPEQMATSQQAALHPAGRPRGTKLRQTTNRKETCKEMAGNRSNRPCEFRCDASVEYSLCTLGAAEPQTFCMKFGSMQPAFECVLFHEKETISLCHVFSRKHECSPSQHR